MKKSISTTAEVNNPANSVNPAKATTSAKTHKPRSIIAAKKRLLQALKDSLGVVSSACETVGISRSDYELYYREDESFRTAVDATAELALDYVEEALLKLIEAGNVTATLFYLKTKGKARGYTERGDGNSDNTKGTLTAVLEELRALYNREFAEEGKGAERKNSADTLSYTLRSAVGQEYHRQEGGYDMPLHGAYSPPVEDSKNNENSESMARHSIDKLFNLHENTYRS